MSTDLPPPLDYANARPTFSRLRCDATPERLRVWRSEPPSAHREMLIADYGGRLLWLCFCLVCGTLCFAHLPSGPLPDFIGRHPLDALAYVLLPCGFVFLLLDGWQNAGIVTQIQIANGWFTWTRQSLFRRRTCRWPAAAVTRVGVVIGAGSKNLANNTLRIHRRGGLRLPLDAFSHCRPEELHWAADAIRAALGLVDG